MNQTLQNLLTKAVSHLRENQLEQAEQLAQQMLSGFPEEPEASLFAAEVARLRNLPALGLERLDQAIDSNPEDARLLLRRAQFLFELRRRTDAHLAAITAQPHVEQDIWQLRTVAHILRDCQDLDGAREWLLEALARQPASVELLNDLAIVEFHLNLPEDAAEHVEQLLEQHPFHPGALHLRSGLRKQTAESNHIEDLRDRLSRGPQHPKLISAVNYALAKELEDLEDYSAAFDTLEIGAQAYRGTFSFNIQDEVEAHEHIRSSFNAQARNSLARGCADKGAIFIVGMPRTGTTLVERILSSHSQVASLGEFSDFPNLLGEAIQGASQPASGDASLSLDFAQLGQDYLAAARQLAGSSPHFVDKLPFNFQYCGYILAAMPEAKIVHLTRNLMDTCYAVYKTLFFGAYRFSYDLDELAQYLVSYRALMDHWHQVFPGRILDIAYEDLVSGPESESRRLLEGCGLAWEPDVLDFYTQDRASMTASAMQVRKPMHTDSIGSWRRAEAGLESARSRLEAAGLLS